MTFLENKIGYGKSTAHNVNAVKFNYSEVVLNNYGIAIPINLLL